MTDLDFSELDGVPSKKQKMQEIGDRLERYARRLRAEKAVEESIEFKEYRERLIQEQMIKDAEQTQRLRTIRDERRSERPSD